jgi:hypothetical protein
MSFVCFGAKIEKRITLGSGYEVTEYGSDCGTARYGPQDRCTERKRFSELFLKAEMED